MSSSIEVAKFEHEPKFEKNITEIKDHHLKDIASAAMNLSDITLFEDNLEPFSINNNFEAATFKPEPTFEKTVNDIKSNHLKIIVSIDMNVSAIN